MPEERSSYYNVGVTIILATILWWALGAGLSISVMLSKLPTAFWIALLAVVLYLIFKK